MSTESGPNISALLKLHCKNNHFLGKLITHLPHATIGYVDPGGVRHPWTDQFHCGFLACRRVPVAASMKSRRHWTPHPSRPLVAYGSYCVGWLASPPSAFACLLIGRSDARESGA
jgi:hypothetical protein